MSRLVCLVALAAAPAAFAVPIDGMVGNFIVGEGIHLEGVTVYPVTDPTAQKLPDDQQIVQFADALRSGTLTVAENGHDMQVASLRVHNRGKHPVLVMAGEVVDGGQQDRIITRDLLIEPSDSPIVVSVNCVERGRWAGGRQFEYGGRAEYGLRRVVQIHRNQDATWEAVGTMNSSKAAMLAALGHDAHMMSPSTGTYMASMHGGALERQVAKVASEIAIEVAKEGNVVGLVVAVGDTIIGSEVYGYPEIFDDVRDETIAAVARDAMTRGTFGSWATPAPEAASMFLADAMGGTHSERSMSGIALHSTVEGESTLSYVLAEDDGSVLHMASYVR